MRSTLTLLLLASSCSLMACLGPDSGQHVDSETHFLTACVSDDACESPLTCVCGFCTKPCDPAAAACAPGVCAELQAVAADCAYPDALPSLGGLCTEACGDTSCGTGFACQREADPPFCAPSPGAPGGPDAEVTNDVGDASETDSGSNDSGSNDSGSTDSGSTDSGSTDTDTGPAACIHDHQCASLACRDGECLDRCNDDADCTDADASTRCVEGACLAGCGYGATCPAGQACWIWGDAAGICVPRCDACDDTCPGDLSCKPIVEVSPMLACVPSQYLGGAPTPACTPQRPRGAPCTEAAQCEDGACTMGFCGAGCTADTECGGAVCYQPDGERAAGICLSRCALCGDDSECVSGASCRTVAPEQVASLDHDRLACVPFELQRPIDDLLASQQTMCGDWCTELCATRACGPVVPGCNCGACADDESCLGGVCVPNPGCGGEACIERSGGSVCQGHAFTGGCDEDGAGAYRYCASCGDPSSCQAGCFDLAVPYPHPTQAIGQACLDDARCESSACHPGYGRCGELCDPDAPDDCAETSPGTGCYVGPLAETGICLTTCSVPCDDPVCPSGTRCVPDERGLHCAPLEDAVGRCF